MRIKLLNKNFKVLDTKEKITIADSYVIRQNKIGTGSGEAKLYVGQENVKLRNFFGNDRFTIKCFLLKSDLIKYLDETKVEYLNPEQPYINKNLFPTLWQIRKDKINALPSLIEFEITEQAQITKPRIYVKSEDKILIASHIKPWSKSNKFEDNKKAKLSAFLSKMTYSKLGISEKVYSMLPIDGREKYLKYHRENIFK